MRQPAWQHIQQVTILPFWAPVTYRQLQACIFHYLLCCGSVSPSSTYCLLAGSGVEGDIKFVFLPFRQSQSLSLMLAYNFCDIPLSCSGSVSGFLFHFFLYLPCMVLNCMTLFPDGQTIYLSRHYVPTLLLMKAMSKSSFIIYLKQHFWMANKNVTTRKYLYNTCTSQHQGTNKQTMCFS